ncbi:MAG: ubiquinol-cytochrome c reductase iron-sulfur subunit [Parvibaculaceae bacterium]
MAKPLNVRHGLGGPVLCRAQQILGKNPAIQYRTNLTECPNWGLNRAGLLAFRDFAGNHKETSTVAVTDTDEPTRRDFLYIATGSFTAIGGAYLVWPLIDQMNPDASALALASIEVDLSSIEVGQSMTVKWRGKPVFIRRRSAEEIEAARAVPLSDLIDPEARNDNLPDGSPADDQNRAPAGKEEWLIMVGICTHLGCVPKGQSMSDKKGDFGGWFCPCHGSHYDTAGRIRKGPAPQNLEVPVLTFLSDTKIKIG